jgi:hypothetical protein
MFLRISGILLLLAIWIFMGIIGLILSIILYPIILLFFPLWVLCAIIYIAILTILILLAMIS